MTPETDNPCLNVEQGSLAFYQSLLADYKQAWECLYISAFRSFIPYARQRSPISTDDALDILQESMAEFALKLKNGKYVFQGKPVAAYVFTVCRNQWVSFLRRNHLQQVDTSQEVADEDEESSGYQANERGGFSLDGTFSDDTNDPPAGPDSIWGTAEVDWQAVGRAFAEVGADCQTMLNCFYVEEKSLGECGARIGLQESSAKVKRFRCAQRLKALYSQYKTA
ncbi:RNA polymerase sigma factor [uncultured Fibrella sp.]|uniref:RNA polymerase sigma factor n=1 Tax=uncultured Fibrella sp. TaxID=1284596 RepID=UPI0035CBD299